MKSILSFLLIGYLVGAPMPLAAQESLAGPAAGPMTRAALRQAAQLPAQAPAPVAATPTHGRQSWVARHPVLVGTLVGFGVGAVVGGTAEGVENPNAAIAGGLGYAGMGGLVGLAAHAVIGASLTYRASGQPDIPAVKRIVGKLGSGGYVDVVGVNSRRTIGTIQAIGEDEFSVVADGQSVPVQVAYADVRTIQPTPLSKGKKIGIWAAVGAVVVLGVLSGVAYND